jgi:hypothetical protein
MGIFDLWPADEYTADFPVGGRLERKVSKEVFESGETRRCA